MDLGIHGIGRSDDEPNTFWFALSFPNKLDLRHDNNKKDVLLHLATSLSETLQEKILLPLQGTEILSRENGDPVVLLHSHTCYTIKVKQLGWIDFFVGLFRSFWKFVSK